jgi:hypothetical protein
MMNSIFQKTGKALCYTCCVVFLFSACTPEEEILVEPQPSSQQLPSKSMMALVGKKLQNPYSINNIRKAQASLDTKENKAHRLASESYHWYVKFSPTTSAEVALLENDSLKLFDFPLDHEITAYPDSVGRDYSVYADGEIPELYTVVDENYTFPQVVYTVLDTLYFPSEEEIDLEYEAHLITGNVQDTTISNSGGRTKLFGFGTKPSGFVRLLDTQKGLQPVVGAYVEVIHFGLLVGAYTNTDGWFKIDRKFVAGTHLSVIFNNSLSKIKPFATHTVAAKVSIPAQLVLPAIQCEHHFSIQQSGSLMGHYYQCGLLVQPI